SYIGVGHNYRWNEDTNEYEELWQTKETQTTIIWYYKDGKIEEQEEYGVHWIEGEDAKGRIEVNNNRGSIQFNNDNPHIQKRILNDLVNNYPGIRFAIYGSGKPVSLQQYWETL
ncbi:MAG: hypothetical protein ACXAC2_24765, partial [Candidatus Kariarchaeaceae archaeon]